MKLENIEYDLYFTLGLDDDASTHEIAEAFEKLERLMLSDENLKYDEDAAREVKNLKQTHSTTISKQLTPRYTTNSQFEDAKRAHMILANSETK